MLLILTERLSLWIKCCGLHGVFVCRIIPSSFYVYGFWIVPHVVIIFECGNGNPGHESGVFGCCGGINLMVSGQAFEQ